LAGKTGVGTHLDITSGKGFANRPTARRNGGTTMIKTIAITAAAQAPAVTGAGTAQPCEEVP